MNSTVIESSLHFTGNNHGGVEDITSSVQIKHLHRTRCRNLGRAEGSRKTFPKDIHFVSDRSRKEGLSIKEWFIVVITFKKHFTPKKVHKRPRMTTTQNLREEENV